KRVGKRGPGKRAPAASVERRGGQKPLLLAELLLVGGGLLVGFLRFLLRLLLLSGGLLLTFGHGRLRKRCQTVQDYTERHCNPIVTVRICARRMPTPAPAGGAIPARGVIFPKVIGPRRSAP